MKAALRRVPGVLLLVWAAALGAQGLPAIPELRARVTDLTGTLSAAQSSALESKLATLEAETGSQLAVLVVRTTRPEAIEQYALRVVEAWQLGRANIDDGALLLVALDDREVRIEVGYGLEGALTDATSRRIIAEAIVPHFRTGDMYGGIAAGVDRMLAVVRGEELPAPAPRSATPPVMDVLPIALLIAFFAGGLLTAMFGKILGATATGGIAGFVAYALSGLLATAGFAGIIAFVVTLVLGASGGRNWASHRRYGDRRHPGGFGGGGLGGGFGGGGFGGGGGGFGGGGGGFGGGGASGSW
jgi:uncharacterized protein